MKIRIETFSLIVAIIFIFVLIAGCTGNSGTSDATPTATATITASGAMYSPGDVVKNPKVSSQYALLIIGYDPSTDMYERALIYPNTDGTWGYRLNANTEKVLRADLEKVYTQKVTSVSVPAIPVSAPAKVTTAAVYQTTAAASSTTATATTTTSAAAPQIRSIDPDNALAGTTVTIPDLEGYNFQSNAAVALVRTGSDNITGTSVNVVSSTQIYCKFVIPSGAAIGIWDIIVTNPDGQSATYQNGFTVHENTNTATTTTTTTTSASASSVTITSVNPTVIVAGGAGTYSVITVTGSNIPTTAKIILRQSGKIDMSPRSGSSYMPSASQLQASFDILPIPTSSGSWDVVVVDSSGNVLATLPGGVTIS